MARKGKLIVLESCDGGGKSTQVKIIQKYLESKGLKSTFIHFPMYGHNEFSQIIAAFLRGEYGAADKVNPYFVADIYAGDRLLYLPELKKKLEDFDIVLLDRYVFSNMAYQAAKYPKGSLEYRNIITWIGDLEFEHNQLPYPDLTLFLDVPIDITEQRLSEKREGEDRRYLKGKGDIHEEDIDLQHKVRDVYVNYLDVEYNYHIIPCAIRSGDIGGETGWLVLSPDVLFHNYKDLIKKTIDGI